jgi:Flp pilus assembly protein TadG
MRRLPSFLRDQSGVSAVEVAILAPVLFAAVLSTFDLGLYFWRWNQAVQAARLGARIAAISDPVSSDLATATGVGGAVQPGDTVGAYERVCSAGSKTCTGGGVFNEAAMNRIFYGASSTSCTDPRSRDTAGMCDVLSTLDLADVTVTYSSSGIETAGMAGSLRPLVTVRISGAGPRLVLFDKILPANLPVTEMTMLAEDLRSTA